MAEMSHDKSHALITRDIQWVFRYSGVWHDTRFSSSDTINFKIWRMCYPQKSGMTGLLKNSFSVSLTFNITGFNFEEKLKMIDLKHIPTVILEMEERWP